MKVYLWLFWKLWVYDLTVISTYVGALREEIHNGENGYIIEAGDIKALADSLEVMMKLIASKWKKLLIIKIR